MLLSGQSTRLLLHGTKILVFTTIIFILANLCTSPATHHFQGLFFVPNPLSRRNRHRTMANEQIETPESGTTVPSSQSPPDVNPSPPGQDQNIESALRQLNTNMGTMTHLLTKVCARLPTTEARRGDSSSSQSPPGTSHTRPQRRSASISTVSLRIMNMSRGEN